jgi:hypothetical protein
MQIPPAFFNWTVLEVYDGRAYGLTSPVITNLSGVNLKSYDGGDGDPLPSITVTVWLRWLTT